MEWNEKSNYEHGYGLDIMYFASMNNMEMRVKFWDEKSNKRGWLQQRPKWHNKLYYFNSSSAPSRFSFDNDDDTG